VGRQSRTKRHRFTQNLPCMSFTLDQLILLRKALLLVEQVIQTQRIQDPKLPFALETTLQVQTKIQQMISQGMWGTGVGFDFNEMIILRTAVWMFLAGLEIAASTPEAEKDRRIARLLNSILNARPTQKRTLN
jgi:hypothetical protein